MNEAEKSRPLAPALAYGYRRPSIAYRPPPSVCAGLLLRMIRTVTVLEDHRCLPLQCTRKYIQKKGSPQSNINYFLSIPWASFLMPTRPMSFTTSIPSNDIELCPRDDGRLALEMYVKLSVVHSTVIGAYAHLAHLR